MDGSHGENMNVSEYCNTQKLHEISQMSYGLSKRYSTGSFFLEILAAVLAAFSGMNSQWVPLIALLCVILAFAFRRISKSLRTIAESGRRISFRSVIDGRDTTSGEYLRIDKQFGLFLRFFGSKWIASLLKISEKHDVDKFYFSNLQYKQPVRKRMNYSQNSFWCSHLLFYSTWLYAAIAVIAVLLSIIVIYGYATRLVPANDTSKIIELIFSIVIGVICLRSLDAFFDTCKAWKETKSISDQLISDIPLSIAELDNLCGEYDQAIAHGPLISDYLYQNVESRLENKWGDQRKNIGIVTDV